MAANWSRNFWNVQKDTDLPPTESGQKKKKKATTPDNGLDLNLKMLWKGGCERLFLHCPSGFPRLGGRESSASLQF